MWNYCRVLLCRCWLQSIVRSRMQSMRYVQPVLSIVPVCYTRNPLTQSHIGPGFGSCANPDECCSAAGTCGSRDDGFCSDGCQEGFGAACTNCAFVSPPPPPTIIVDIGLPLAQRFCCQWFTIDDITTCNNLGVLGVVELDELDRLNPGAVGAGCVDLQAGAA
jgi:hypothetical protein